MSLIFEMLFDLKHSLVLPKYRKANQRENQRSLKRGLLRIFELLLIQTSAESS